MNGWFLSYIVIAVLGLGITMAKHGKSKSDEKYNFWSSLIGSLIGITIVYMAIKVGF